jgi:opacity protein-like surface antigen
MQRSLLVVALCLLVLPGSARAQAGIVESNRMRHWDFSVQTRYIGSHDIDGEHGSSVHLSDDLGWGFGFGYHANEHLNLGFLMSWRAVPYDATMVRGDNSAEIFRYSNWLDTGTLAVTGDWNILAKTLTPYVNGGLGWTMVDTNIATGYSTGYCWWDPWYGYICDSYVSTYGTDALSYALGAGVRWEPSRQVFLRVGYERSWVDINQPEGFDNFRLDVGLMY